MGRPKGFNGKCEQYRLRLSQEENYILKKLAEKEGLSKAEVLRKGLKIFNYLSKNGGIIGYPEIEENDNDINGYPKTDEEDEDTGSLSFREKHMLLYEKKHTY